MATDSAISYTLSEDKQSAIIHIDVDKIVGTNELIEVKDQDNNLLTEYDIKVTENGTYSYTVIYKEAVIKEAEPIKKEIIVEEPKDKQDNQELSVNDNSIEGINQQEIPEISDTTPTSETDANIPESSENQEEQVTAENQNTFMKQEVKNLKLQSKEL